MFRKVLNSVIEFGKDMGRHNVPAFASSAAFFFFLSIFPTLMFICSLIPYLPFTESDFVNMVAAVLPISFNGAIKNLIDGLYRASISLLPITAIATLWTAGMGIMGLIRGLNGIFELEERRNYFLLRIRAAIYTLIILAVLFISVLLIVLGKPIINGLIQYMPHLGRILKPFFRLRGLILWVILTVVLDFAYTFLPSQRQRKIYQLPGALIASGAWCVVTWAFSIYVDYFHGFSAYGSLTAVMVLLFWLNICFNILMFGAFFNKYYQPFIEVAWKQNKQFQRIKKQELNILKSEAGEENNKASIDNSDK